MEDESPDTADTAESAEDDQRLFVVAPVGDVKANEAGNDLGHCEADADQEKIQIGITNIKWNDEEGERGE